MRSELILCLLIFLTESVFGVGTDEMKTEEVRKVEGESATLHSGVQEYHQISWMLGPRDRNIAQCRGNADGTRSCEIKDEGLRDRLEIDNHTGSLIIINISTELAGLYKLQVIDISKNISDKEFNVTVSEAGPERDHTGLKWGLGLGLGLLVLVGVGIVIYCCCKKYRTAGRNEVVYQYVKNGGTVFRKIPSRSEEESLSGNKE